MLVTPTFCRPQLFEKVTKISGLYAVLNGEASDDAKQSYLSTASAARQGIKVFVVEI